MKFRLSFLFLFIVNVAFAHQPDLSNLMIYEQNGKKIVVLKSSLTAFEGEVDFHFNKGAYQTPEEFIALAIKHFEKNCVLIINEDTVKWLNIKVMLGHETTLFAVIDSKAEAINTLHLKSTFFKDMHHNQCEVIISLKDIPQYQYVLNDENKQEVNLVLENNKWVIGSKSNSLFNALNLGIGGLVLLVFLLVYMVLLRRKNGQYVGSKP